MYKVDLCHLGDACAPGIIIDEILNIRKKTLFMLGIYKFNDILNYLTEGNYENIYNKEDLYIDLHVKHRQYNFVFNHDYLFKDAEITNYDFIKARFDLKIKNFKETLAKPSKTVYINFTSMFDRLNINEMCAWLDNNTHSYHLIIFTDNADSYEIQENQLSVIKISKFSGWWLFTPENKKILYREIYEKFIECCTTLNIDHNFPNTFDETYYGQHKKIEQP
jgi:hypothetical protein